MTHSMDEANLLQGESEKEAIAVEQAHRELLLLGKRGRIGCPCGCTCLAGHNNHKECDTQPYVASGVE